jgi:hypothetical protein
VAYPFQWGSRCKELIAGSQPADSGKRLAAIEPIVGLSLPQQFKRISSGMLISAISKYREAYCRYKLKNCFRAKNAGKLSATNMKGLSVISSYQWQPHVYS